MPNILIIEYMFQKKTDFSSNLKLSGQRVESVEFDIGRSHTVFVDVKCSGRQDECYPGSM